jgi:glycosyltransferase involved in cell wall biosynthesis
MKDNIKNKKENINGDIENKKIAVLIPCYNESKTIEKVIKDYKKVLPEADIYVYDNNSSDGTDKIAKKAGAIIRYEYKQGKGNVIRSMFKDIDADCYLMIDGDDTYPKENAREMCDYVLNGQADMVIGDRLSSTYFTENKRPFHNFGNRLVRGLINTLFKSNVRDIMTGYRAFSYDFVKTFPVLSKGFEIETEMTIHALDKNFLLKEIPVEYRDRPSGSVSKLNTFSDGFKVLKTIGRLFKEYKPSIFFGLISLLFFIISLCFGIPVFVEYFKTNMVPRFPTLIFSGFMLIVSILMFVCGVILEVVVKKHRQLFELFLINTRRMNDR